MTRLERKRQEYLALMQFLAMKAAERGDMVKANEYLDIIEEIKP